MGMDSEKVCGPSCVWEELLAAIFIQLLILIQPEGTFAPTARGLLDGVVCVDETEQFHLPWLRGKLVYHPITLTHLLWMGLIL